jgi:uncharacterized damage-inducible protein DinB
MTWTAPDIARTEPDTTAPERRALEQWLRYHRETLLFKCQGLSAEQLKTASAPPSNLTLLGLVRHMAEVERSWFRHGLGLQTLDMLYCSDDKPDGDFDDVAEADAEPTSRPSGPSARLRTRWQPATISTTPSPHGEGRPTTSGGSTST